MNRSDLAGLSVALAVSAGSAFAETAKWDRVANIKAIAVHVGDIQRAQGAGKALSFIDACYRTHGLGSAYSKSFEGCIVADHLLAQAVAAVTGRVPADELRKSGMAEPAEILAASRTRIAAAFGQYDVAPAVANAVIALTSQHGMGLFLRTVFPNAADADAKK